VATINYYPHPDKSIDLRHGDKTVTVPGEWINVPEEWKKPLPAEFRRRKVQPYSIPAAVPAPPRPRPTRIILRPLGLRPLDIQLKSGETLHSFHVHLQSYEHLDNIVATIGELSQSPRRKLPENLIVSLPGSGIDKERAEAKLTNLPETTLVSLIVV
jgi:hypothetical protein